jgi:hypothetical protein
MADLVRQDIHAKEAYLQKIEAININATEYITGKKTGVFAYLETPEITTITTSGTFQAIEGTFNNAPIENFDNVLVGGKGAIRYLGAKTQFFMISLNCELKGNSNNITASIATSKNGNVCTNGSMSQFLKNQGQDYFIGTTCVYELAQYDTVQLVTTNNGTGDQLTFNKITTSINEFFD